MANAAAQKKGNLTMVTVTCLNTRYQDELNSIPPSGGGGCHVALLRIANYGRIAGLTPEQVAEDLRSCVHGSRRIPQGEIIAAVRKAFSSTAPLPRLKPPQPTIDGPKFLDQLLKLGAGATEADFWEASPVRIDWEFQQDAIEILRRLYRPDEFLFLGSRFDSGPGCVLTASEWLQNFYAGQIIPEHVAPNPLSGKKGLTKDDKPSWRADACVASFRFAVIEFDQMARDQQIWFWMAAIKKEFPVSAVIDSGNKSLHGWVRVDSKDVNEWTEKIENRLFTNFKSMGVDGACRNEARLSRMPGHYRTETGHWQRLLYLDERKIS
jgi:hypothetical protein